MLNFSLEIFLHEFIILIKLKIRILNRRRLGEKHLGSRYENDALFLSKKIEK